MFSFSTSFGQKKTKGSPGEKLFIKYDCISCHGKEGKKPFDMTGASQKYDREGIRDYIKHPKNFGNLRMPSYDSIISETDYALLIEHVLKLGKSDKSQVTGPTTQAP